jgi:hypothetical protein
MKLSELLKVIINYHCKVNKKFKLDCYNLGIKNYTLNIRRKHVNLFKKNENKY